MGRNVVAEEEKEGPEGETFKDVEPRLDVDFSCGEADGEEADDGEC